MSGLGRLLLNPDGFFEELLKGDVSLKGPAGIVFLNAVVALIPTVLIMQKLMSSLPEGAQAFAGVGMAIGAVGAFLGIFAYWIIGSAVFHALSSLVGGEGSFRRTVQVVGYGFLPSLLGAIVGAGVMLVVLPSIEFSLSNPEAMQQSLQGNSAMAASSLVNGLFYVWSGNIWVFGMMHARDLSRRDSLMAVGIPVGLMVLWQAWNSVNVLF